jgi:predicted RNA-binding protein YlxR (DUF448 family)
VRGQVWARADDVTVNSHEKGPWRTCLGCGKKQQKSLLHRLVVDEAHQVVLDTAQTAPGRGAYLCGLGCLAAAKKRRAFQRAFRSTSELAYSTLEALPAGVT